MSDEWSEPGAPDWIRSGRGLGPTAKWSCATEGPLTCFDLAAETGEVFAADEAGTLLRLDRAGRIAALTRLREPVRVLDWSDDGRTGVAVSGEATLHRLDRDFQSVWKLDLPEVCIAVAAAPFGTHFAVSLANGRNFVYSEHKRREAEFETIRPLSHLRLCTAVPVLIGAAEHDLLCCHTLAGEQLWDEKLWSNAGGIAVTGDGDLIYVAGYHHGIQTYDGEGQSVGAYVVEGTVNRVAVSYDPNRLVASTLEHHLYWLDAEGQLLWASTAPDEICGLHCDSSGEWAVCGFDSGRLLRLDWGGG